jgi:uncharacterized membrane protein
MKNTTPYFSENNNTLNKGYDSSRRFEKRNDLEDSNKLSFLPDVKVMSAYEEIYPGSLKSILEIAKTEQINQYKIEKDKIAKQVKISLFGNMFGFLGCCIICATTIKILSMHMKEVAIIFAITAFACMFGMSTIMNFWLLRQKKKFQHNFAAKKNFHYSKNRK